MDYLDSLMEIIDEKTEEASISGRWVIFYKGKRIKLKNGKQEWKTIGHAKAALTDKIKRKYYSILFKNGFEYSEASTLYYGHIEDLIEVGVLEFVKVD